MLIPRVDRYIFLESDATKKVQLELDVRRHAQTLVLRIRQNLRSISSATGVRVPPCSSAHGR